MTTPTACRATILPALFSMLASIGPPAASAAAAQAPERSIRFAAAEREAQAPSAVPADAIFSVSAGPVEDFGWIMGIFGGAAVGALVGCVIDCSGDDGIAPAAFTGALVGIPVGAVLMLLAVRLQGR